MTIQELRTSERKTFGTCPKQWWWSYVEGLTTSRTANPLWFGTMWHEALAAWYLKGTARGPHPAETFASLIDRDRQLIVTNEDEELSYVSGRELGIAMANNYVDTYGLDEHLEILAIEETFALIFKRGGEPYLRYLLTMDGLLRDLRTGEILIFEHKTAKQIRPGYVPAGGPMAIDNQCGSYYAAAPYVLPMHDLLKPGERISGILYNIARKAIKDDRPQDADGFYHNKPQKAHYQAALADQGELLTGHWSLDRLQEEAQQRGLTVLGEVSKDQPPKYFHREPSFRTPEEQVTQLQRIKDEALYMREMRAGNPAYPVTKTPGEHCNWCPFRRMCELDEQGETDAVESFRDTVLTTRDPYSQYRKAA